jgi:cytochrome c
MFDDKRGRTRALLAAGVVALAVSGGAIAADGADLAKSSGCMTCHDVATKKMGPAFKEVAAKNKGKADAEKKLVEKLKEHKDHPTVKASEGDLGTIVKWVLAQ